MYPNQVKANMAINSMSRKKHFVEYYHNWDKFGDQTITGALKMLLINTHPHWDICKLTFLSPSLVCCRSQCNKN